MKKRYFIGSTLVIALCAIVLCAFADQERTDASEAVVSERPIPTTVSRTGGKVLVAYFSVPETDGVDASSGASDWYRTASCKGIPNMWRLLSAKLPAVTFSR